MPGPFLFWVRCGRGMQCYLPGPKGRVGVGVGVFPLGAWLVFPSLGVVALKGDL